MGGFRRAGLCRSLGSGDADATFGLSAVVLAQLDEWPDHRLAHAAVAHAPLILSALNEDRQGSHHASLPGRPAVRKRHGTSGLLARTLFAARPAILGTLPSVLTTATGLAAITLIRRLGLEQFAASPIRALENALGIDVVVVMPIVDASSQAVRGARIVDDRTIGGPTRAQPRPSSPSPTVNRATSRT